MAIYEYYCPSCREKFEQRRPMSEATSDVRCREGHPAQRTISAFAMVSGGSTTALMDAPSASGGGCCGGACGCSN